MPDIELRWHKPTDITSDEVFRSEVLVGSKYMLLQFRQKDDYGAHSEEPDWGEWENVEIHHE